MIFFIYIHNSFQELIGKQPNFLEISENLTQNLKSNEYILISHEKYDEK